MMNLTLITLLFWSGPAATHLDKAQMEAAYPKHSVLLDQGQYRVMAIGREKDGQAEVHAHDTDVVYFVSGTATLLTGGKVKDGKSTGPGEVRGAAVEGGTAQPLKAGDVVTIPNGTPHQFANVHAPCKYFLLKVRTHDEGKAPTVTTLSKGGALAAGDHYKVSASHRDKDGIAEQHARDTDVMFFVKGTATIVTGGTVAEAKSTAPEEVRGTNVEHGTRQALQPGDVMVVPNTVPHQFVDVKGPLDYFVVKVRSAE